MHLVYCFLFILYNLRMSLLVIANWKANPKTITQAKKLAKAVYTYLTKSKKTAVLAVPAPYFAVINNLKSKRILLGAQDISSFSSGPHTGDIPGEILSSFGVRYVIVGHSERRALGEPHSLINQKIIRALNFNITPVVCVGELSREHLDRALSFVKQQIETALVGISRTKITKVVIAYEPVWAISSNNGRQATPEECKEMIVYIRKTIADIYGQTIAKQMRILYGGSVSGKKDATDFAKNGGAQGFLVGRASLDPKSFDAIVSL